jgi:D-xylonolactonase
MDNYRDVPVVPMDPVLLEDHPSDTGEGPLWDDTTNTLTWNDIPAGTLFRYDPARRTNVVIYQHTAQIGGHTLQADGSLVLFSEHGQILLWKNGSLETIVDSIPEVTGSRFNDVIADPAGNVFCGTMPLENGAATLYRLDTTGKLTTVWDDLTLSNGMGFSPDQRTFYLSDSDSRTVYRAEYANGELHNREVLIRLDDDQAVPDGMTVDGNGDLWVAVWDGSCLLHYSDTGDLIDKVMFPVRKVSSLSFGNTNYGTAFVTTAGGKNRDGEDGPLAGSLFAVDIPDVHGKPDFRSRILL